MRFLFVSDFVRDPDSGAAGTIVSIGDALRRAGHTVDYEWKAETPRRVPHLTVSQLVELPRRQYRQVSERLRKGRYDVVIVSQPYAYLVYERLRRLYPDTVFLNRTHGWEDRLYDAYRELRWDGTVSLARRLASRGAQLAIGRACVRTIRSCHGLIAPSSLCTKFIESAYDIDRRKLRAIPYGLDREVFDTNLTREAPSGGPKLLYVGNYITLKGSRVLESVLPTLASKYPHLHVTFVVDSGSLERVRVYYEPSFGHRVTVESWVSRSELREIYRRHDILLYPSLFEGFGKVWLEAMSCGMCVVGFAEGGLPDVATSGRDALYCQPGDTGSFASALEGLVSNPERVRAIGSRAQQTASQYTWDRTAQATEAFCQEVKDPLV